jgi:hypothetical protein
MPVTSRLTPSRRHGVLLALSAIPVLALADPCVPDGFDTAPERGLHAASPITVGVSVARDALEVIPVGGLVALTLRPVTELPWVKPPESPQADGPTAWGGVWQFRLPRAGRWRFAIDDSAWIDVLKDGQALVSTGHQCARGCALFHKLVDFELPADTDLVLQWTRGNHADGRLTIRPVDAISD